MSEILVKIVKIPLYAFSPFIAILRAVLAIEGKNRFLHE